MSATNTAFGVNGKGFTTPSEFTFVTYIRFHKRRKKKTTRMYKLKHRRAISKRIGIIIIILTNI